MRRFAISSLGCLAVGLLLSTAVLAGGRSPADFPLRVHIYQHNSHSHSYHQVVEYVEGEGRANLYENGAPRAFDYSYRCGDRIMNSIGYETYLARWKKPGKSLEVLLPVMGKPNAADTCELKVEVKDGMAYYKHNGLVNEEPAPIFKEWMEKHQYDPEHGLNQPVSVAHAEVDSAQ